MRLALTALACCVLAGCLGNPQRLPVGVSLCDGVQRGNSFDVVTTIENSSSAPITRLDVAAVFYRNFRYQSFTGSAALTPALDPGNKREVSFRAGTAQPSQPQGQAIRCYVTHVGYLDGTAQDAPPSQ